MSAKAARKATKAKAKAKKNKVLMLIGSPPFHMNEEVEPIVRPMLEGTGRWKIDISRDLDLLAALPTSGYSAVLIHTTGKEEELTGEREKGFFKFVEAGGGVVGVHCASDSFRGNRKFVDLIGGEFLTHPPFHRWTVSIDDADHYITQRMHDWTVDDELYIMQSFDPKKVRVLASTVYEGKKQSMLHVRTWGKGRVVYIANGHGAAAWRHPEFQKTLIRSLDWTQGAEIPKKTIRCGLLGYGPAYGMGKYHSTFINAQAGMKVVAVCDKDASRLEVAKEEVAGIRTFTDVKKMLKMPGLDLVVVILPHNLHAWGAMACLEAGKHVILEKPMCLTSAEATKMIRAAKKAGVRLSVFHNRRWDADFMAIRNVIASGRIGEVFHVEAFLGSYGRPGQIWRSDKEISGGLLFDWGAHFTDWLLNLMPGRKVAGVQGFLQKKRWFDTTNEDHAEYILRFDNGASASFEISQLAMAGKQKWRILGTEGAISGNGGTMDLAYEEGGQRYNTSFEPAGGKWDEYYRNVADHLLYGEELVVKPEEARRAIAVLEAAEKSAKTGHSEPVPYE